MAELPHMPLATDAYLGDTRHLTTLEHGAYLLLLMIAWRCRGRPQLVNDDKVLARCAGLDPRTWQRVKPNVMAFWTLGADGFWTQAKQLKVREVVSKNVENQRNRAAKRWAYKSLETNEAGDAVAYAGEMPDGCQPNPNPSIPPKAPKVARGSKRQVGGYDDPNHPVYADFLTSVWSKRWKRDGHNRFNAYRAYESLSPADREAVKANIERCGRWLTSTREDATFRPMLQSWLNSRGWETETASADATGPNWPVWLAHFRQTGDWNTVALGPAPGRSGCKVPPELLIAPAA